MIDFPHKIGEWITEEKEKDVLVPVLDKKGNVTGLEKQKQTVVQKVQYTQSVDSVIDCGTR